MTATLELDVLVIRQPCETCAGMGYHDDGAMCDDCTDGTCDVELVRCPSHGMRVARAPGGGLLGQCDGCAAEAARGLSLLSGNSTRDGGSILGDRAAVARRGTS